MDETVSGSERVERAGLAGVNRYIGIETRTKPIDLVGAESCRRRRKDSARRMGVSLMTDNNGQQYTPDSQPHHRPRRPLHARQPHPSPLFAAMNIPAAILTLFFTLFTFTAASPHAIRPLLTRHSGLISRQPSSAKRCQSRPTMATPIVCPFPLLIRISLMQDLSAPPHPKL